MYNLAAHRVVDELVESRRSAKRPPAADIALILVIKDELKRRAAVPAAHEQQAQCANACKEGTMHSHWNRFPADVVRKQYLRNCSHPVWRREHLLAASRVFSTSLQKRIRAAKGQENKADSR